MSLRSFALALALLSPIAGASYASAQDVGAADGSVESVGSAVDELQGRPNAANGSACGCSTAGARTAGSMLAIASGVALLGIVALRRRLA